MLNVNEIRSLEERWKQYNRKKYLKFFSIIFIFCILVVVFLFYYFGFFGKISNEVSSKNAKKIKSVSLNKKHSNMAKNTSFKANAAKLIKKNSNVYIRNDKNISKLPNAKADKTKVKNALLSLDVDRESQINTSKSKLKDKADNIQNGSMLQLNTKFLSHIYDEKGVDIKQNEKYINDENKSKANQTYKSKTDTAKMVQTKQQDNSSLEKKPKILISSKKIDKLKYLKNRYDETGRAFYAILISKEYYEKKLYLKSLKWATIANNIDSSNEESWIMFAKNKVKLGKRNDAIKALGVYLRVNKSKKIKILLTNIKNGVFK